MKKKGLPLTVSSPRRGEGKGEGDLAIQIRNETSKFHISLRPLKVIVRKILKALGFKRTGLSILFVGDKEIRSLNRRWLGHDRPTDVIAFPGEGAFLGDIVISLETTRRQAKQYGNYFEYELATYLCHGILHLKGHCDKTKKGAARMEKLQERILRKIWPSKRQKRLF